MKVKDLLEQLKGVDPETEIAFGMEEGCCGDVRYLELNDEDVVDFFSHGHRVEFRFDSIPGYYSCRQIGGTIKSHNEYWKNKPEYKVKG